MRIIVSLLLSYVFLFAVSPQEMSNTLRIEKRIAKMNAELEKKMLQRLEKGKLREARLKRLDELLEAKAIVRENASNLRN